MSAKSKILLIKRKSRNRFRLKSNATLGLRLTVFRSNANFYSQIIDEKKGITLVSASTLEKDMKKKLVGAELAKRADKKGIKNVYFDRGGYLYHGRVKAFAEAVRKEGLKF